MSKDINKLIEPFRTSVKELINKAKEADIPILITETTRSLTRQRQLVKEGKSRTMNSKHLVGKAVDIAFLVDGKLSYNKTLYNRLYKITENIPYVIWPYKDFNWKWDWPHHQYDKNKKVGYNEDMKLKDCQEEARKLNTELGKVTPERDQARDERDALAKELTKERLERIEDIKEKEINYDKWQDEIDRRKKCELESKEAKTLLDRIKDFFT